MGYKFVMKIDIISNLIVLVFAVSYVTREFIDPDKLESTLVNSCIFVFFAVPPFLLWTAISGIRNWRELTKFQRIFFLSQTISIPFWFLSAYLFRIF